MTLTANREVDHYIDQELRSFPVATGRHLRKGALVGVPAGGYVGPLLAGDSFAGIAYEEADNTAGADGALSVRVYTVGDFGLPLAAATPADVGRPVFATADDTLTFQGFENSYVGVVQDVPAAGEIILRIDPLRRMVKTVTHAVEDLAAGADIAARAIHHFSQEGWLVAARVVNQATAATGIDAGNTCIVALVLDGDMVATVTFNGVTAFPNANTERTLGTISPARAAAGAVLKLAVTNGTTANPGPFLLEVDYV
ncbi:MAG TPA: hypothetical protein PKK06_01145 [Phycisphaerae bacterium]|nr:hypothetical protein [Phycisphaerae bacterium]HNU43786.1 hypothetical protein [Phycisphaerae bacterium]